MGFIKKFASLVLIITTMVLGTNCGWAQSPPTKIGIIGTGKIGSALAKHWAAAGYELVISSRHPEELEPLAKQLGDKVRTGTPQEAAAFGEVVLVSTPYGALPQIGKDFAAELKGKIILDTANPFEGRDGPMAADALKKGVGRASADFLPGTLIVRAYNCIPAATLANNANKKPERIAIPIASDDAQALEVAQKLISDSGFDAVVIGNLEDSKIFELGQPLATGSLTAKEMKEKLSDLRK